MGYWQNTLNNKIAELPNTVKTATAFLSKNSSWLNQYKGGMPIGFFAAIAALESNAKMIEGDPNLGEFGYYQIAAKTPTELGLSSELRKSPEGNIFLAGVEYNIEAKRLALKYPNLIQEGTIDQWKMARLVFAIGRYGTDTCINLANPTVKGDVFGAIERWADATGATSIGSSEADKIWYRIKAVSHVAWAAGRLTVPHQHVGVPVKPPAPRGMSYRLPADVANHLHEDKSTLFLLAGALVILAL